MKINDNQELPDGQRDSPGNSKNASNDYFSSFSATGRNS